MSDREIPMLRLLQAGLERGGFQTDDVLAVVLPLFRQTLALHEQGMVGPFDGASQVEVDENNHLVFGGHHLWPPKRDPAGIERLQQKPGTIAIMGEVSRTTDVEEGRSVVKDSLVVEPGEPIQRPAFIAGYRTWEQAIGHHDELTDIFFLGLVLATFSCGLDLSEREDLDIFVSNRENLFAVNPRLNPVLASVIVQMTELNRHQRVQDLGSIIRRLEAYREQPVDLQLGQLPGLTDATGAGRRRIIQEHLRDRLFDLSRRNRLVHFRSSGQTLNLTLASVPLLLDYRNIRLEQLFVWHEALAREVVQGRPLQLAKYLRFEDAPYISGVLDKMISEARRDRADFGVSQLRLVVCFLRWHNLKEDASERIHSPLLLLPVELTRKRGVRDSYILDPTTSEAEVNPALRHYLKQLYDLSLAQSPSAKRA